jgi:hypothetical protein
MTKIITIKEAVKLSGLTETALRTGIANGTFPAFRVGSSGRGKFMLDMDELEKAIKELARSNMKVKPVEPKEPDSNIDAAKGGENRETVLPFTQFRKVNG